MGRRGPAPKPSALRVVQGNPGKLRVNPNEPKPQSPKRPPDPPQFLVPLARIAWERLAPVLHEIKLLTKADLDLFAAYCCTYARWRELQDYAARAKFPKPLRSAAKLADYQFALSASRKELTTLIRLAGELGLSPAARTKIYIETDRKSDEMEKRIFG